MMSTREDNTDGGVAHLGERMTGSHKVRGSIPLISTRNRHHMPVFIIISYLSSVVKNNGNNINFVSSRVARPGFVLTNSDKYCCDS